jgi:putative Holliday junction resolvase
MSRIIGIDYGTKRVGVAVSDDSDSFAFPYTVLENNETLLESVVDLATKQAAELIVIGEADNPAGGENTVTRRITIFGEALKVRSGLDVVYVSEAYSTKEARRVFEELDRTRKTKKEVVDSAAAAIILQSYLDGARHTHGNE